ncbi:MAG TPA: HTTM domain-containing protein [Thermoanaerobaculia bacterium]|nr:HTTM domain-containing protein [Thermoanaerobaculia bacterium]
MGRLHRIIQLRANPQWLAAARMLIGVNAAFASLETWRMLSRVLQPPVVKIPFFPWVPLLPSSALPVFLAVWLLAALLFALGWKTRVAGAVLSLVTGYTLIMDQQTYSNHLYLLFLVILLLTIAECTRRDDVAAWPILLLKIQITLVYVFSAMAKITPQYLAGEILTRSLKQEGWLAVPQSWRAPDVMSVLAVISIAAELLIAFGLWSRRLRLYAIVAGIGFHLLIIATLDSSRLSLAIFALDMFAVYLLFVDAKKKAPTESQEHFCPDKEIKR